MKAHNQLYNINNQETLILYSNHSLGKQVKAMDLKEEGKLRPLLQLLHLILQTPQTLKTLIVKHLNIRRRFCYLRILTLYFKMSKTSTLSCRNLCPLLKFQL